MIGSLQSLKRRWDAKNVTCSLLDIWGYVGSIQVNLNACECRSRRVTYFQRTVADFEGIAKPPKEDKDYDLTPILRILCGTLLEEDRLPASEGYWSYFRAGA